MLSTLVTIAAEEGETTNPLIPAWYDIIWSAVCFVVILFVFWKVVLPKMQTLLDERAAAIEGNIEKADEAQEQAAAALEQYTAQLAEARKDAGEIREAAREDSRKILAEAKDAATGEAARITAAAHAQIEAERQTRARVAAVRGRHAGARSRRRRDRRDPVRRRQGAGGRRPVPGRARSV